MSAVEEVRALPAGAVFTTRYYSYRYVKLENGLVRALDAGDLENDIFEPEDWKNASGITVLSTEEEGAEEKKPSEIIEELPIGSVFRVEYLDTDVRYSRVKGGAQNPSGIVFAPERFDGFRTQIIEVLFTPEGEV